MKLFLFIFSFLISKAADFFVGSIFTSFSSSWPTAFPSCEKSTDTTWEIHKWGRATLFVETWGLQNNSFFRNIHLCAAGVPIDPTHPFLLTCISVGDKRPNTKKQPNIDEKVGDWPNIQNGISKPGGRGFSEASVFLAGGVGGGPWCLPPPEPGELLWSPLVWGLGFLPSGSWASCRRSLLTGRPSSVPSTAIFSF